MNFIFSFFYITFYVVILLLIILSILILFFERKFIGIAQKRLGISFLGRNGWIHLPADIIKFWSKSSYKNNSFWFYSNISIFIILATYYIWNLISVIFFVNNQNSLNFDYLPYQILIFLGYANLTTLYLFFIISSLKSKYAIIGGLRIIISNIFLEFSFILNYYLLFIYCGGFSFNDFVFLNSWSSYLFIIPISSFIFFIYTLYEAKRAPFDHAEAESELVAGHIIEFSGKSLLFFFFRIYSFIFLYIFNFFIYFW
jgi:NADH-quinone oxidoreductase subunit H